VVVKDNGAASPDRILEWRHYVAAPGRADALLERFERHTFDLFDEYGVRILAFGRSDEDPDHIHYVCEWDSEEQMRETWARWKADERWQRIKAESEKDGPLTERIESTVLRPPANR
jgi:heme-degrading monooxygenase HmoA